ncbi:winged helix-turn-helix domain-containing protein [Nesterenkonia muleiensis]|uniref:winged helix-turn-helix domain-containing protein n=1 Tax=Nesterenkonia muleiensis TaxID=2282648 RepID=UPI001300554F|nr:winged helix-turn-helix domain-containing protein [Nesterenkonia muleiensis]
MDQVIVRNAVGRLRFAPSPLCELALSTMIVRYPERHPFHEKWFEETAAAREKVGKERVLSLINPDKWILDTLMQHPVRRGSSFAQELAALAEVPATIFRRDAERVWGSPPEIMGRTDSALKEFVLETVEDYWHACFAAHWPAFKRVLEADVTYRGAELAANGVAAAIGSAIPAFMVRGNDLVLPLRARSGNGFDVSTDHRGVTFLPTLVKWGTNLPNLSHSDLIFTYRARGRGRLAASEVDSRLGLVGILGRTRTELLVSLDEPASSTAIALFMGVTTAAVNQHLRALARAGLLQTNRFGRYVLYERTELADQLIAAG